MFPTGERGKLWLVCPLELVRIVYVSVRVETGLDQSEFLDQMDPGLASRLIDNSLIYQSQIYW